MLQSEIREQWTKDIEGRREEMTKVLAEELNDVYSEQVKA